MNEPSSIIYNSQEVETTQMSARWWLDKQMCNIYTMECHSDTERNEGLVRTTTMDKA